MSSESATCEENPSKQRASLVGHEIIESVFAGMREGRWERRRGRVRSRKEFEFYFNYSETSWALCRK